MLKRLKPKPRGDGGPAKTAGAEQMKMLRRLPKLLRFIPGTAQDVRAYFLALQYWLAGSEENLANLVRMLVQRYAAGPRAGAGKALRVSPPLRYPEVGLYHPRAPGRVVEKAAKLPAAGNGAGTDTR